MSIEKIKADIELMIAACGTSTRLAEICCDMMYYYNVYDKEDFLNTYNILRGYCIGYGGVGGPNFYGLTEAEYYKCVDEVIADFGE